MFQSTNQLSIVGRLIIWLVVSSILKNMKVNGKDYPIYDMENEKCLKPPTSNVVL